MSVSITATVTGPFWTKSASNVVARAIEEQILDKVSERMKRGGKGLGAQRNVLRFQRVNRRELVVTSSRNFPRTKGTAWVRKNTGYARAMSRTVTGAAVRQIAQEMGR